MTSSLFGRKSPRRRSKTKSLENKNKRKGDVRRLLGTLLVI